MKLPINKRTVAKFIPRVSIGYCVERVVNNAVKGLVPAGANLKTKIIYKVGVFGISTAATHVVCKEIDEVIDVAFDVNELRERLKGMTVEEVEAELMKEFQNDGHEETEEASE